MTLLERDKNAPAAWHGDLPVTSRYTYGLAGEKFFRAIKDEEKIMGTLCAECGIVYVPGVAFCERCLAELVDWVDVGTVGVVHSYTLLFEGYNGQPLETPEVVAFINLGDGGLVHKLDEVDLDDLDIGMIVEAVFKPAEERVGSVLDIAYFRPVDA